VLEQLDGDLAPSKMDTAPNLWPCGQTARWIKMTLGIEVGLGTGDIVLDGDPAAPHGKGHSSPHFWAHVHCGQTIAHLSNCKLCVVFSLLFLIFSVYGSVR